MANTKKMTMKMVEYCYPTSPNAERFHLPEGGYVIQLFENPWDAPTAVAAYTVLRYAIHDAKRDPRYSQLRWHPTMTTHRSDWIAL